MKTGFVCFWLMYSLQCLRMQSVCVDKNSEFPLRFQKNPQGKQYKIKSCSNMVKKYPILCKEHGKEGGLCCQKCKSIDYTCLDDYRPPPTVNITNGEYFSNCKNYIKKYPCKCKYQNINASCCKSCQGITCPGELPEIPKIKLSNGDSFSSCEEYILGNPCHCLNEEIKEMCKEDCQEIQDVYDSQRRTGSISMFIHLLYQKNLTDESSLEMLLGRTLINECSNIVDWFPFLCSGPTSGPLCCLSCFKVDTTCVDNLYWKTNVSFLGHNCTNCNCHEIHLMSPQLMNITCHHNIKGTNLPDMGAREACCHQCNRMGFSKPEDYETPKELHYGVETFG